MTWTPINFNPGFFPDDTPRTAAGFFTTGDKVRFVRQKLQSIGGWETASTDSVEGIARNIFGWRSNDTLPQAAIGTNTHLQVYYDGDIYDATPIVSYTHPTFNVTTTLGSTTVTVSGWTHSLVEDQRFEYDNASPATVGGVTIDGAYTVLEVLSATAITFTAASAATSAAGPTSVTCDANIYLAPGLVDGTAGAGYGVGPFGGGDFGEPAELAAFYPRTYALDQWGQNLLANPRGGGIYELAPNYSQPQLVTNGDFASGAGWTTGTGWTIGAGVATATAGVQSLLETTVTLNPNAYFLLEFGITRLAGTITPQIGTTDIGAAINATGTYRRVFYTGTGTLNFDKDSSFGGTVDNVSVKQLLTAHLLPGAPTQNYCIVVTPELIVLAGGTIDADTGLFNPMQIRSSDTGDGDLSANRTWTNDPANTARRWNLSRGSRIVRMLNGNGEVLCWTDAALYSGTLTADTNTVYRWRLVAENCGLVGPNAVTIKNGVATWITPGGKFKRYAGGIPFDLESPAGRDFWENVAPSQQEKIIGFTVDNKQFSEDWFIYPDFRDGNECSRYVMVNAEGHWAPGTFDRTAWMDTGAFGLPLAVSSEGTLYWQEKGKAADSDPIGWTYTTASLNQGKTLVEIMGMIPDFEAFEGGATVEVFASPEPNADAISFGSHNITSATAQVDLRALGYSPYLVVTGTGAPSFMRMGVSQFDMRQTRQFR